MKNLNQFIKESLNEYAIFESFSSKKIINVVKKYGEKIKKWYSVHLTDESLSKEDKEKIWGKFKATFKGDVKTFGVESSLFKPVKINGIDKISDNDVIDVIGIQPNKEDIKDDETKEKAKKLLDYINSNKYDMIIAETEPNGNMVDIYIITKKDSLKYAKSDVERNNAINK